MKYFAYLIIIITVLFMGSIGTSNAQSQEISEKGIKVGLNIAKFTGKDADFDGAPDPQNLFRYALGGYMTFGVNNKISIRPELLYSVKGSKYVESETFMYIMNYLDLPILGIYSYSNKLKFLAGPYVGIFLSGKVETEWEDGKHSQQQTEWDEIALPDFGIVFGGSYALSAKVDLEVRYSQGFRSRNNTPSDWMGSLEGESQADVKHRVIQLMVNYTF